MAGPANETFIMVIEGLDNFSSLDKLPPIMRQAARIAVNHAATKGRSLLATGVLNEVALPRSYVQPGQKRLHVKSKATDDSLEAVLEARGRRTSLTRFIPGGVSAGGAKNSTLMIKVGKSSPVKQFTGAFLFKLKSGSPDTDTKGNYGFALRTKTGKPDKAYKPTQIGKNLFLLYGPSVSQILHSDRNKKGVVSKLTPRIQLLMEQEYYRQIERLT